METKPGDSQYIQKNWNMHHVVGINEFESGSMAIKFQYRMNLRLILRVVIGLQMESLSFVEVRVEIYIQLMQMTPNFQFADR